MKFSYFLLYFILSVCFLFTNSQVCGQGKIMLVGGGAEDDFKELPNWSNAPYQWAVNQTANKKVAVIAFNKSDTSSFLIDYFTDLGASRVKNFVLDDSEVANDQTTFDSLMVFDLFFFKGGDQANYYNTYKDSKVTEAITQKYEQGGVIAGTSAGMAILSEVIYPAIDGTVYPDELLRDANDEKIILKEDFVNILPGFITDTHFIERGRFPRLIGFMGKWLMEQDELIDGIGIDDQTALCIDSNFVARTFGNGAVSIMRLSDYGLEENKPISDSVQVVHLLSGTAYNLKTHTFIEGYNTDFQTIENEEVGNYKLYLFGSSVLNHNTTFLSEFIEQAGDYITIVSQNDGGLAKTYADYLENNTDKEIYILTTSLQQDSCIGVPDRNQIRKTSSFLFIGNSGKELTTFLSNDKTGKILHQFLFRDENVIAFIGEDAKFAGKYYVDNNTSDELNAFYGDLNFEEGLGLLETTTVLPDAFPRNSSTFYENNAAAVKYCLIDKKLKYGLYINERSFLKFYQQDGRNYINGNGTSSSILLENQATKVSFASEAVNNAGDKRNIVGFDKMKYSFISGNAQVVGKPVPKSDPEIIFELPSPKTISAEVTPESKVILRWESDLDNNVQFSVLRSEDQSDFTEIAILQSNENTFTDSTVSKGKSYQYRISAFDANNSSCYVQTSTSIVITSLEKNETDEGFNIINPVQKGMLQVMGKGNKMINLTLTNMYGQQVLVRHNYLINTPLSISDLSMGMYLLRINYQNKFTTHKLIISH